MKEFPIFNHLWDTESAYVDCTPKQYREFLLEHGMPIMFRGEFRDLGYKKIGPGVIRVTKVRSGTDGKDRGTGESK